MRIGLFGARADNSGLGNQTKEFFDHLRPAKTVVIDISAMNGKEVFPDRFPNSEACKVETVIGFPSAAFIDQWLSDIDLVFCIEIPYNYYLFEAAKRKGIRTVLQYNYEFLDYLNQDFPFPDALMAPSTWNFDKVRQQFGAKTWVGLLPVPVNTAVIERRVVEEVKTFIHVSGYKLFEDRNGTLALIKAIPLVKNKDLKFIIYSQHPVFEDGQIELDPRIEIVESNLENYWDLYKVGDALILPRKYGGLSLQCNEAMAAGMPVIMPNIAPNPMLLHKDCLFEAPTSKIIKTRTEIECYDIDTMALAERIDFLADAKPEVIREISEYNATIADQMSWNVLTDFYIKQFEYICEIMKG